MKQRIKVYTTTKSHWFTENFPFIVESLQQSKGRTIDVIDIETFTPPKQIPLYNKRPSWEWFKDTFRAPGYNVKCLHISEYYKKKWGINSKIGGTYRNDPDRVVEFWIAANRGDTAKGYDFDQFTRRFIHEMLHGDTYHAGMYNTAWVHLMDYQLHKIHEAPQQIDYTKRNIMEKLIGILNKLIPLYGDIKNIQANSLK